MVSFLLSHTLIFSLYITISELSIVKKDDMRENMGKNDYWLVVTLKVFSSFKSTFLYVEPFPHHSAGLIYVVRSSILFNVFLSEKCKKKKKKEVFSIASSSFQISTPTLSFSYLLRIFILHQPLPTVHTFIPLPPSHSSPLYMSSYDYYCHCHQMFHIYITIVKRREGHDGLGMIRDWWSKCGMMMPIGMNQKQKQFSKLQSSSSDTSSSLLSTS